MNKNIVKKVSVEELMDILSQLYTSGVDFVDIGSKNNADDTLRISFNESYMNKEFVQNYDYILDNSQEEEPEEKNNIKLTKEDLNKLI